MIDRVKNNLAAGLARAKWIATFLADRTRAGTSVAKLLYESNKLDGKINEHYKEIGQRVAELKEKGEGKDVFTDFIVQQALNEIRVLKEDAEDYRNRARNINKIPE